jgi:hypothetical protein
MPLGRTLGEKVGNLKRGGRLGRVKPTSSCIKPLGGTGDSTASGSAASLREEGAWTGSGVKRVNSLKGSEAQESNVLLCALIQHRGVTDLQSAESLEAEPFNRWANGKKAHGPERVTRLIVGERL